MKYFLLILLLTGQIIYSQNFLKAEGKKIVDSSGENVLLQGIGLGGWLVPEGYMIQSSAKANSPTEIKNEIIDLVGSADAETIIQQYKENFYTETDIQAVKNRGINSVRLPLHYNLFTPKDQPFVYIDEGFDLVDTVINWCRRNDLWLILDLHCAPGGQSDEPISDYVAGEPSLWENDLNKERTYDLWAKLAARYKDEDIIAGYDLLNEPAWDLGTNNAQLRDFYEKLTDTVRIYDQNHILFIEGNWFATDFAGLTPPMDDNMVYAFHKYWNSPDIGSINYLIQIRETHDVPLWLGESGENSNEWLAKTIRLVSGENIGYNIWTLKKIGSIAVFLNSPVTPQYQQIIDYWNGSAQKPSQLFAKAALLTMVENLKYENCAQKKDFIDAVVRLPFDNTIKQFSENEVPGIIFATEYDMGENSVSYKDADYQNISGSEYNNGYSYRNDGVDIEGCSDAVTNGYNVGWIENSEWIKYTVHIAEEANYNIGVRYASESGGGRFRINMDDGALTGLYSLAATGGWQNWQTYQVDSVDLPAGEHVLQFQVISGGFNLNYLEFQKNGPTRVKDEDIDKLNYRIDTYPNPFNSELNILLSYSDLHQPVSVKLYSITGEYISEIYGGVPKERVCFDFGNLSLASGNYLLQFTQADYCATKKVVYLK